MNALRYLFCHKLIVATGDSAAIKQSIQNLS